MSKAREPLESRNALGEVRPCGCGGVNLSMGPVTLHVDADEVEALYELGCAAYDLVQRQKSAPRRRGPRRLKPPKTLH